ncbi:hypothetical protein AGMMS50256_36210 [Betaproteobacteria bacterium]|nr:hypothetical protein AGMMS50256_36210 [Betaproteobacteria bacterium]
MDIPLILGLLSSAKDIAGTMLDIRDSQKLATVQIDLTNKIIEAQIQLSQVLAAIIEKDRLIQTLAERNRVLEAEQNEKARYQLCKLGTVRDFFAYRLRPASELTERVDEPPHFLCQPCFDAGKKIILIGNGDGYWHCPVCKIGAQTTPTQTVFYGERDDDSRSFFRCP